jgi:hypothetical protein
MATVFEKDGYEIIALSGAPYMLIGLPVGADIAREPAQIGDYLLNPGEKKIRQIGKHRKGQQSALWQELIMFEGSFLQYAGTFADGLVLFEAFKQGEKMFQDRDLFGEVESYGSIYAGFYNLPTDDCLIYIISTCAPRLLYKHFDFIP